MGTIDNYTDMIDSRDVIARIEELRTKATDDVLNDDEQAELEGLEALALAGASASEDWKYGATLIRDSYFKAYAQDLAEDLGMLDEATSWPMTCIDWEQATCELQQDYTPLYFDDVMYWVR